MGYRRGFSRSGTGVGSEGEGEGRDGKEDYPAEENHAVDERVPTPGTYTPKKRRRRPWLRVLFVLFLVLEGIVLYLVHTYSPVFHFEITSVTVTGEDGVVTVRIFFFASVEGAIGHALLGLQPSGVVCFVPSCSSSAAPPLPFLKSIIVG